MKDRYQPTPEAMAKYRRATASDQTPTQSQEHDPRHLALLETTHQPKPEALARYRRATANDQTPTESPEHGERVLALLGMPEIGVTNETNTAQEQAEQPVAIPLQPGQAVRPSIW